MISAVNGQAMDSQPLMTGLPAAHAARIPFGTMTSGLSDRHLGQLDVQEVEDSLAPAFPTHAARLDAAEGRLRGREREAVDADHAGLDPRHRLADAGRV